MARARRAYAARCLRHDMPSHCAMRVCLRTYAITLLLARYAARSL